MSIGRIGDVRFLDSRVDIHGRWVCKAQLCGPDGDHIGHLALRLWREARAKLFDLGVVGRVPWVDEASSAKELVGCIVLNGPFDLAIGEVIEPLEKEGSEVATQREFSAKPPFALGRGALKIAEDDLGERLPREDQSQLDQRMVRRNFNGYRMYAAGSVKTRKAEAHSNAFSMAWDLVRVAVNREGITIFRKVQPHIAGIC